MTRRGAVSYTHLDVYKRQPYFNVVKPTIARGFDYKSLQWANLSRPPDAADIPLVPQPSADRDAEALAA